MKKLSISDVQTLVSASFTSAIPKSAPGEIVYIPVGSSTITPSVNGKPQKVTVNVPADKGDEIAARMQKALERRLASSVRPRLAFDHAATGPAAGHPKSFSFDPARGLILSLDWSNSGRSAIEGGDYGYFSPSFLMGENGEPVGLSDIGEIGSLVDEPAFREIGLIAASDMSYVGASDSPRMLIAASNKMQIEEIEECKRAMEQAAIKLEASRKKTQEVLDSIKNSVTNTLTNQEKTMPKQILAALNISDTAADAEGAAVSAIKAMQTENTALKSEKTELTTKLEAAQAEIKAGRDKRADDLVKAAVTAGKILPKDEETQSFYRDLIAAGNADAEKALEKLPELNGGLDQPIVKAGQDKNTSAGEHKFITAAKALVTSKEADTIEAAYGIVAQKDPALYEEFRTVLA